MLCAQHALNTLLQGNYYDPSQLADIAKQLDGLERGQVDDETWRNRDQASLNMDDTGLYGAFDLSDLILANERHPHFAGYFSISVLEKALEVWGIRLVRWRSEEMRPFQACPEEQLAFVLNLDSHWFTIRSFTGGYWFNLNSFLEKPSWVGPSYLGALLGAAESEGYSVFVAVQAESTRGDFHNSIADECAATLSPASFAGGQGAANEVTDSSAQGLKPTSAAGVSAMDISKGQGSTAIADDDADLQAALRASLADADSRMAALSGGESSRLHSPTIAGQRRTRGGMLRDLEIATGASNQDEETDDQVDAIAPSRRRARGLGSSATASASSSFRGSPYILPTASGGRRRASRQVSEEGESASFRLRRQRDAGATLDQAISVDYEDEDGQSNHMGSTDISLTGDAIEIADDDEFEQMQAAASAPRSPFLNPALIRSGGSTNSDDDFHSLSSGDEDANLGESWVQGDIDVVRRQAMMQNRAYDDEDAQFQAALAASMREAGTQSTTQATPGAGHTFEDDLAAASWINEEDSRAIREAQASFNSMIRQASNRSNTPPPADVERIARMRAEAKRKAEEEETARLRGETAAALGQREASPTSKEQGAEEEEQDSSDEDETTLSPEEIRRARLARFNAA